MTDSLERYFIRRVRHAPAPQSMRPLLATICLLRAASCLRSPESVPPMSCACSHGDIISHARVCASTMCMDAKTLKSNASACIPVAQVHEKGGRSHHGGFRDPQAGEHRVLHAVVESGGFELLVNFGSIDTVSRAPRIAAPPETVRSRALCLACHPLRLCCDHLTCTRDRFSCFRRPASVRRPSFASGQRDGSGARPVVRQVVRAGRDDAGTVTG